MLAAGNGHKDVVQTLLKHGAAINHKTNKGKKHFLLNHVYF